MKNIKKSLIIYFLILYLINNIVCQSFSGNPTENQTLQEKIGNCMISYSIQSQNSYRFINCNQTSDEYSNWQSCCNHCCTHSLSIVAFTKESFQICINSQMIGNQLSPVIIAIISGCLFIGLSMLAYCLKEYFFQEIERQISQKQQRLEQNEKKLITTSVYKENWISRSIQKQSPQIIETNICIQEKYFSNCRICNNGPALLQFDCSCKFHKECYGKQVGDLKSCLSCHQPYHFVRRFCRRCEKNYLLVAKQFFFKNQQELSNACQNCAEDEVLSFRVKHSFNELKS